ncbi:hypothetical protein LGAA44_240041 [Leuconostoc gasicomitatum]|nr:hypothetical protein LGAA44_240041 [Leuconostoc gasicomitatum]
MPKILEYTALKIKKFRTTFKL